MKNQVPFDEYRTFVKPEWVDHNQHLNVAYYVLAFDLATDEFYRYLGIPAACYDKGTSFFTLDMNVTYHGEVVMDDALRVTTQLLAVDHKRIRYFHHMYHAEEGYLAATNECVAIHVDMNTRKSVPMPDSLRARMLAIKKQHDVLGMPENANRQLRI